ncbi:GntR family transcriptional regulator [Enterococcus faecium]|nr:GntR family transcriptional regulator [Enterococcus faecium]
MYSLISTGTIPCGEKLPNETELADSLEMSRVTIRRALDLLKEDGIIKGKRGIGNFVIKNLANPNQSGLEKIENPIYDSLNSDISNVLIESLKDTVNEHDNSTIQIQSKQVMRIKRWYQSEEKNIAVCYSIVDPEFIEARLPFDSETHLLPFMESSIYLLSHMAHYEILFVHVPEEEFEKPFENSIKNHFILLREILSTNDGITIAENKFYIPLTQARIQVNVHKK